LPQLRLLSRSPVTVTGAHFVPRERVKVRLGALVQTVRVNSLGSFVARFPLHSDPCNGTLVVTAVGAGGETARVKAFARMCAPAP
jgi:hypothetical protein